MLTEHARYINYIIFFLTRVRYSAHSQLTEGGLIEKLLVYIKLLLIFLFA